MKKMWTSVPLGEVCDVLDHKRKPITKRDREAGKFPYYGATGVLDHVAGYLFDEPLVLVGEDGAKWASGENTAFAVAGKIWVNNHAHVLRPHRNVLIDNWLIYHLNHSDLTEFVSGLTVPKLNQGSLREIPVPVPPLPEQQRIVAILDEAFTDLATAKANAEKNHQNARALFESHLQSIFTQRGEGWVEKSLEDLGTITSSKRIFKSEYVSSGVPFYRTKEIKQLAHNRDITTELFISETRYKEIKTRFGVPQEGDILLTAIGTIGEIWVVEGDTEFYFKDGNVLWLKGFTSINPGFLRYVLVSFVESLNKMAHGSAYSALPIQRLNAHRIFLPSKVEQEKIVATLDSLNEETQRLARLYEQKQVSLAALKQSLLHQAFSGQL